MSDKIYKIKNITKTYMLNKVQVEALRGINLEIKHNECLAFIGPSGSGKSTLLHILGTIDNPTSGSIYFNNTDLSLLSDKELSKLRSNKIGFIFQNFNLIPILNVFENIEYPLKIMNISLSKKEYKEKILGLIEEVGLSDTIKHKPGELSGGQRQRVAIARALVANPIVILADEPTANLDSKTGYKILELIRKLSIKYKSTVIFSTHDQKVIDFVDKKINICDGLVTSIENK